MENGMTVNKVNDTRPEGTRNIGRPKLRLEDGVVQDIRALGVKHSRNVAMDREDWRKVLKGPHRAVEPMMISLSTAWIVQSVQRRAGRPGFDSRQAQVSSILHSSDIQRGVRVPPGIREDILGST
jgi:hypothetical protein